MSLKTFHIVFIAATVLLCLTFAAWEMSLYTSQGGTGNLVVAILSVASAGYLIRYGVGFLRRLKKVSFI